MSEFSDLDLDLRITDEGTAEPAAIEGFTETVCHIIETTGNVVEFSLDHCPTVDKTCVTCNDACSDTCSNCHSYCGSVC